VHVISQRVSRKDLHCDKKFNVFVPPKCFECIATEILARAIDYVVLFVFLVVVFQQQYGPAQPVWPDRAYPTDRQNGLIPECGACTIAGGCRCVGEKGSRVSLSNSFCLSWPTECVKILVELFHLSW